MGSAGTVLLIGEQGSLAAAIADLLVASGVGVTRVSGVREAEAELERKGESIRAVVCANGRPRCPTLERWKDGPPGGRTLIVVGARDESLAVVERVRLVPLPLVPVEFVRLVIGSVAVPPPADAPGAPGVAR